MRRLILFGAAILVSLGVGFVGGRLSMVNHPQWENTAAFGYGLDAGITGLVQMCAMGGHMWLARSDGICYAVDGGFPKAVLSSWH